MSIEMDETIRAIVFCQFTAKADFMVAINEPSEGSFTTKGRMRFYEHSSDEPWDEGDRKAWFTGSVPKGTVEECLEVIEKIISNLRSFARETGRDSPNEKVYIVRRTPEMSVDEFLAEFQKQPFVHVKIMRTQ